jgi:DNA-binding MarR family transcriptional regulator
MSAAQDDTPAYRLDDQIGYVLRRVTQRHLAIFSAAIPEVTTTQFAVLARLAEIGPLSQNHLGRATAMDAATIKGVVDRLAKLGLVATTADPDDRRRLTVALTEAGAALYGRRTATALEISQETLAPLAPEEQALLLALLSRLT